MEGYSESRRKLYKKWFKDDPDVNWVDRQTGKASTIDDKMSIPYLTVKDQPVDAGGGGAVPPRKPPSGSSGADVPPVDPTDPKVQTTFNPKFTGDGDPDVQQLILDEAEKIKNADAAGLWPHKRTFKDIANSASEQLPKETIENARLFNARYGRGGESDLPATLVAMNRLMNRNAKELHRLGTAMSQALATGNKEGFNAIKEDLIREAKILDGLITLNKPLKTVPAQTLAANKIGGGVTDTAATIDDLPTKTPAQKATDEAVNLRGVVDEGGEEAVGEETLREIIDLAEKGDIPSMRKLRIVTNRLQAAAGNPEALRKMAQEGPLVKGMRINNEIFINSILSGPETHAVNILSTALNTLARPLDQIVGSASIGFRKDMNIGFKESLFSNPSNLTVNPQFDITSAIRGGKELYYLMSSISDSFKMAKAAFRIEDNIINPGAMIQDSQRFQVRMDGDGPVAGLVNKLGTALRLPSRFLLAEDEFFKALNFRAFVKASAWENGMNKGLRGAELQKYITDQFDKTIGIVNSGSMKNTSSIQIAELYEKAQQYAAETTFTADLGQGSFGKAIQGVSAHPAGRIIFPFVRTPVNIFKATVRRTPGVNIILQEYRQALRSSDPSIAAKARGEMITGGALWSMALLSGAAINDPFSELAITGGGPTNIDLLNQKRATGWQPYSFRFLKKDENGQVIMGKDGKPMYKYVSYKRFDPWASFLSMAADGTEIIGQLNQQDREDFGTVLSVAMARNITNKTYLQGVTELTELMQNPNKFETWVARRMAAGGGFLGVVPFPGNPLSGLGRSFDKLADPTIMDKKVKAGDEGMVLARKFFNELAVTIPGYNSDMRPLRNFITGSLIEYPPGYGPDIMNIMNPIKEKDSINHRVLTILDDLQIRIEPPSDTMKIGDAPTSVKLTTDEYADLVEEIAFAKINGITLVKALDNEMRSTEMKGVIATANGENINSTNMETSVAAQETARITVQKRLREIVRIYKKVGRSLWFQKNPEKALQYQEELNSIKDAYNDATLENLGQLQTIPGN